MIKVKTHLGSIELTKTYLSNLIAHAASSCFGVVRMNPVGAGQGARAVVTRSDAANSGVKVSADKNSDRLIIDLHITVMYGVNVAAITDSIMNKVRYVTERETGLKVGQVNVFVDGMENG